MEDHSLMPERRRRARILTVKNLAWAAGIVLVVFIGFSIRSEFRDTTSGKYGRLYGKEVAKVPSQPAREQEVVTEETAPAIAEQNYADPTLVEPARRAAYLGTEPVQLQPVSPVEPPRVAPASAVGGSDLAITGGPEGVTVVKENPQKKPVLGGGFGQ
jgi:hypothetical protein